MEAKPILHTQPDRWHKAAQEADRRTIWHLAIAREGGRTCPAACVASKSSIGERLWERPTNIEKISMKSRQGGGDGGIRTLDTAVAVWLLSRELVSAAHPRLRITAEAAYNEGLAMRQAIVWGYSNDLSGAQYTLGSARKRLASARVHCRFRRKGFK